jgi:hypothetical protein
MDAENNSFVSFSRRKEGEMAKTASIPGKLVPQDGYSAFVPAPLPPTLDWTPRLIRVLSDADRLIGAELTVILVSQVPKLDRPSKSSI